MKAKTALVRGGGCGAGPRTPWSCTQERAPPASFLSVILPRIRRMTTVGGAALAAAEPDREQRIPLLFIHLFIEFRQELAHARAGGGRQRNLEEERPQVE